MSDSSFFQKIWSRQVLQLLGTYLAVGFGVLQFVEFMTSRYDFSGAWVDRYLILWLGLIPAVALLIYYRGLPPAGKGSGWKRSLVGVTALLAGLSAMLLPGAGSEPETEVVSIVSESGQTTQRVIPASSSVQRIAIFDFTNVGGKEEDNWWGTAYGLLLNDNLQQRPEILTTSNIALNKQYDRFGAKSFDPINLATQRRIAQRAQTDYFVRVEYAVSTEGHEANGNLYRSRDGKPVQTLQGAALSAFEVVDQLKAQIVDYLPTLDELNSISTELPASALITDKPEALEAYAKGRIAFGKDAGNLEVPTAFYRESYRIDPNCASCAMTLGDVLYGQGKKDSSLLLIRQATRLAEVLPERGQYNYKGTLLSLEGEYESLVKLLEGYRKVYPYEYYPYESLANYYDTSYGLDSAIHLMETAALLSDREKALIKLYNLQMRAEKFEAAENSIKDLEQEFPDEEATSRRYAKLYQESGQIDRARELIKERMATDPMNIDLPNQLLQIEQKSGNYREVERVARDILKKASTQTDSITAWNYIIQALNGSGRIAESMKELDEYEDFLSKMVPRSRLVMEDFITRMSYLMRTENYEDVYGYLDELASYDPAMAEIYRCYLPLQLLSEGVREEVALDQVVDCMDQFAKVSPGVLRIAEAYQAVLQGDEGKGADIIDELLADKQVSMQAVSYARINRTAGRYERATELLENELKSQPNQPDLLLELAQVKNAQGDVEAAKTLLPRALKTWEKADENFRAARIARELAVELGMELQ